MLLLRLRQACLHPKLTMVERGEDEAVDEDAQEDLAVAMNPTVVNRLLHDDNDFSQIEVIMIHERGKDTCLFVPFMQLLILTLSEQLNLISAQFAWIWPMKLKSFQIVVICYVENVYSVSP